MANDRLARNIRRLAVLALLGVALTAQAQQGERWPGYGEWEQARFAAFSPLVRSVLARDEDEAIRLIEADARLDEMVSEHEIRRLAAPRVKIAYVGGEPPADYPLVVLAAVANLPRVVAAIGQRSPERFAATDPRGNTALAWAARSGHLEVTRILLATGLDPLRRDDDGYTPLSLAVRRKEAKVVGLLVAAIPRERYAQLAVAEQVWIAAYSADSATLRALLEAGVPPDYIAPQGNSALISAVDDANLERVELLLKHGATVDDHRYRGRSIFEIARANQSMDNPDAAKILRLIEGAQRSASGWKKSAEVERVESLLKMISGK
ncbi:MAG: ankyrin repeat protein 50-like [Proteobacteria bacterium]|nr:ankyrin repeat protein 50-like [Pseudomonadota bacterium]MBS1229262.1 ankyrin repeat protein 50-like [Pseudomonadota bacterium]